MTANTEQPTIQSFRKEYIWGFTQGIPMYYSEDGEAFQDLMRLLSNTATISIGASFHPYQLLNRDRVDVWEALFNNFTVEEINDLQTKIDNKETIHINPPSPSNFPIMKWDDKRLFVEENGEFEKYVPFVIPFLSYNDDKDPLWLANIQAQLQKNMTAKDYIEEVNEATHFLLPEPAFVLGFDVFDPKNPAQLIEHYVSFLNNVIKA